MVYCDYTKHLKQVRLNLGRGSDDRPVATCSAQKGFLERNGRGICVVPQRLDLCLGVAQRMAHSVAICSEGLWATGLAKLFVIRCQAFSAGATVVFSRGLPEAKEIVDRSSPSAWVNPAIPAAGEQDRR